MVEWIYTRMPGCLGHHMDTTFVLRRHGTRWGWNAAQPSAYRGVLENSARGAGHVESRAVNRAPSRFDTHTRKVREIFQRACVDIRNLGTNDDLKVEN